MSDAPRSATRSPLLWIALTLLLITVLGMGGVITYLLVSGDNSGDEISQRRRGKSKLPPELSKAFNQGFNPDYEDDEMRTIRQGCSLQCRM